MMMLGLEEHCQGLRLTLLKTNLWFRECRGLRWERCGRMVRRGGWGGSRGVCHEHVAMRRGAREISLGQDASKITKIIPDHHELSWYSSTNKTNLGLKDWGRDSRLPTSLPPPDRALTIAFIVLQSESRVSLLDTRWGFLPILFNLEYCTQVLNFYHWKLHRI